MGIRTIFAQETKAEAYAQWDKVADALRDKHAKLDELMDAAREDVLTYLDYPKEHWAQIASTNPLERLNKEIKRRADVVGFAGAPTPGSLPNDAAVSRRYFSLESLAKLDNTQPRQLAAVAS